LFVGKRFEGKSGAGLYGDVIQEIDWSVGEVMAALKRNGIVEQTLVVFTSDNGPWLSYGNHAGSTGSLREGKGTSWEGGTRVPCVMQWPGQLPPNTTSNDLMMTIDLLPTFAGLVGAPLPELPIDGRDVWSLIKGEPGARNPHEAYFTWYNTNELQAVTTGDGRWKMVLPHTFRTLNGRAGGINGRPVKYETLPLQQPHLYELVKDPGESNDVAASHPAVVERLLALADEAREDLGDALTQKKGTGNREPGRSGP